MTLFAATPKQVEQYLILSNAEEELISMEAEFSAMQSSFTSTKQGSSSEYDMQMLSIRFRDYLQRKLSEKEMTEILDNYKELVLLQFASASGVVVDENQSKLYLIKLKKSDDAETRIDLVDKISKKLYTDKMMEIFFDELIKPLLLGGQNNKSIDSSLLEKAKKEYITNSQEDAQTQTLYVTREFSIEELERLLLIVKTPASDHEVKAVFGATAYALKDFFLSMRSRYDVNKHTK